MTPISTETGTPAQRLRALWARPGVGRVAGAHNALGAKLAVQAGLDAIWSSGFEISSAHGVPDASILTMTEYLAAAESIAQGVAPVPVIADCDTGYGNSNNVMRMVRLFEAAGVAAVCIEDKCFPKTNSFIDGKQELASVAEFVGKILAAKNAQRTREFAVIARTEALIAGWGVDEALRRADAYVRAGADALLIHDKSRTAEGIREFMQRWTPSVPVIVVPTTYPTLGVAEADALGIKMVIYANQGIRAAARAVSDTWRTIMRDGNSLAVEGEIAPLSVLFDLQGMPAHRAAEQAFDRSGAVPTRAILLHAGDHRDDPTLASLTGSVPLAALDVNGQSLVHRQVEVLRQCGIADITVVAGYRHDAVPASGARLCVSTSWPAGGEVGSLLAAPATPDAADARTLVWYGDVLVERPLIERLLATADPCTVVVDRSDRPVTPGHTTRDFVHVDDEGTASKRFLSPSAPRRVLAIGSGVDAQTANGEFAGLVLVSSSQWPVLRDQAEGMGAAAVPDLLQRALAGGLDITALEVTSGWLELRSFADYELACRLVSS
ncbi:MAG: isocitrate lyase/phosphoenolpyruvate mutase family protein [Gemmatimonadota bacterium]|nr:isocitrate lyase/phosphoenolpyruvate mutase family protein [Gemmatimonadota bacterium]